MAKASVKKTEVIYTLQLNSDEALTLWRILRLVGGDPRNTNRRFANDIHDALSEALLPDEMAQANELATKGSIEFSSPPKKN